MPTLGKLRIFQVTDLKIFNVYFLLTLVTFLAIASLTGCGDTSPLGVLKAANETQAMSQLKQLQTIAAVTQMENDGRYPTIQELIKYGDMVDNKLSQAWDGNSSPEPISGYIFGDVTESSKEKLPGQKIDNYALA